MDHLFAAHPPLRAARRDRHCSGEDLGILLETELYRLEAVYRATEQSSRFVARCRRSGTELAICCITGTLSQLAACNDNPPMNATPSIYRGFCFPGEIISNAVFLYH